MRLASRLFRFAGAAPLAPPSTLASNFVERGRAAASEVAAAVLNSVEAHVAPPRSSRGGRTAVTLAAVTATAVVATAAYVWWRHREQIATAAPALEPAPGPEEAAAPGSGPVRSTPVPAAGPSAMTDQAEPTTSAPVSAAPARRTEEPLRPMVAFDCEDGGHPEAQRPTVAASQLTYSRPPATSGRFAMPGVRNIVLPGGGRALP